MKKWQKSISVITSVIMAASLAACGNGGNTGNSSENGGAAGVKSAENCVYSTKALPLGEDVGVDLSSVSISKLYSDSDRLYAIGYSSSDVAAGYKTLTSSLDGTGLVIGDLLGGTGADLMESCVGSDGNYYVITVGGAEAPQGGPSAYSPDSQATPDQDAPISEELDEGPVSDTGTDESEGPTAEENQIDYSQGPTADENEVDYSGGPGAEANGSARAQERNTPGSKAATKVSAKVTTVSSPLIKAAAPDNSFSEADQENPADTNDADTQNIDNAYDANAASPDDEALTEDETADGPGATADEYTAEEVVSTESPDGAGMSSSYGYTISCVTPQGELKWSKELLPEGADSTVYYVSGIAYSQSGILVSDALGIELISANDGSFVKTLCTEDKVKNSSLFELGDGRVALQTFGESGQEIIILDPATGELKESVAVSNDLNMLSMAVGKTYPLYVIGDSAIYGLPLDGSGAVKVVDYIESDLDIISISAFTELADGSFAAVLISNDGEDQRVVMTKVDDDVVAQRKTLRLGCYYMDYEVRKQVLAFNKASQDVHITIEDYSQYDSTGGNEGLTRLNTDIVSGNAPDIILVNDMMPVNSYTSKGVLEDLTPYFDKDEELDRSKFLTNVFDAFAIDGKMYTIVPSFYALAVVGKTSDIADGSDFTLDKVNQLVQAQGVKPELSFGYTTRDVVFAQALQYCGDRFIDWNELKSNFDSEEFIQLLNFVKQFPANLDSESMGNDTSAYYRSGTSLFQIDSLGGFDEYVNLKYGTFGTDITLAGFPSVSATKATIAPQLRLAIGASSKDKDACWSFVRRFLLDDYQKSLEMYWPVSLTAIDARAESAKSPIYYTDVDGNQTEEHVIVNIGGEDIQLPRITQEEVDQVKEFLSSLTTSVYNDSAVNNIIYEEAEAFFEGQKSAEEVAGVIQSRVQIYINENS